MNIIDEIKTPQQKEAARAHKQRMKRLAIERSRQMNMIEKVARALHRGQWSGINDREYWRDIVERNNGEVEYWIDQAKTAIAAVRDASFNMSEAGLPYFDFAAGDKRKMVYDLFEAMIDVALEDE